MGSHLKATRPKIERFHRNKNGWQRAIDVRMILLITPSERSQECADAIKNATEQTVQVAASLSDASAKLKGGDFAAVIIDHRLEEADPDETDRVIQHLGMATPLFINFAISGLERIVRETRVALHRRKKETQIARQGAEQNLRNELKDTVTALLLSCEIALQVPTLPAPAMAKLRAVDNLARQMRTKLGGEAGAWT